MQYTHLSYNLCIDNIYHHIGDFMTALVKQPVEQKVVLAKAVLNAADQLGLKQSQLAAILGVHRTAISRLKSKPELEPSTKQGELALLLIRVSRALFALTNGDEEWMRHFLNSPNRVTGGVPIVQMESIQGLVSVLNLIDGLRGKI